MKIQYLTKPDILIEIPCIEYVYIPSSHGKKQQNIAGK